MVVVSVKKLVQKDCIVIGKRARDDLDSTALPGQRTSRTIAVTGRATSVLRISKRSRVDDERNRSKELLYVVPQGKVRDKIELRSDCLRERIAICRRADRG